MDLFQVLFRTVFFYFFIVLVYRFMGKREIGQLGIVDLIVSFLIAELVAISIERREEAILLTIIPILVLVFLEIGLAYLSMKNKKVKQLIDGNPSLIVCNGKVNYKEMIKQRYSLEDLLLSLRQKQIKSIEDVEYAFLESNGRLSVFKFENYKKVSSYPMPIIIDGSIDENTLKRVKKSKSWLNTELGKSKIKLENIFYAFLKDKKLFIIKKEDFK